MSGETRHSSEGAAAKSPLLLIARGVVRRAWWRMAIAGLVLATLLSAAAYKKARPVFAATGMIRVSPTLPRVLYGNEENQQLPFYDVYLNAQAALVASRPVLERAVADARMREAGWPEGPEGVALLARKLAVVKGGPRSELVEINVSAGHPMVCTAAVNSVLDAFEQLSFERQDKTASVREHALEQRLVELDGEMAVIQRGLTAAAGEYGADNIDRVHLSRVEDLQKLDEKLRGLDRSIAEQRAKQSSPAGAEETNVEVRRLVALDHTMGSLIVKRLDAETELERAKVRFGTGHRSYKEAVEKMRLAEAAVAARIEQIATLGKTGVLTAAGGAEGEAGLDGLIQLREGIARVRQDAAAGAMEIDQRRAEVARLVSRREQLREMTAETKRRRDQMYVETTSQLPGRVSVAVRGMVPVAPSVDKRVPFAAGGGAFGLLLGAALGALPGLVRPRLVEAGDAALLGAGVTAGPGIPEIQPGRRAGGRLVTHQLSMLRTVVDQSQDETVSGPLVVAVVSTDRGEGKTNVALGLARAFADAGRNTVLVDADLLAGGLSRVLSLGESIGLRECLRAGDAGTVAAAIAPLGARLMALPVGRGTTDEVSPEGMYGRGGATLSRASMHRVVSGLPAGMAEVVVIDTAALSEAPDALAAAALADQIVLVVRAGQSLSRVRTVADRLGRLCGGRVQAVMNRVTGPVDALAGRTRAYERAEAGPLVGLAGM